MPLLDSLLGPLTSIIDKIIPDKAARERAKIELVKLEGTQELQAIQARLSAIVAEAGSADPWTSRARPSFLYTMYALLLWALPMGLLAAFRYAPASVIAPLNYLQLLWAGLLGWLVFGHVPDATSLLGMAIIAVSGAAIALKTRRPPAKRTV